MITKTSLGARALCRASLTLLLGACGEIPDGPAQEPTSTDRTGYLAITVWMTGVLLSRTASVTIDDTLIVPLEGFNENQPASASARVQVKAGRHRVNLSGVESNCDGNLSTDAYAATFEDRTVFFLAHCRGTGLVAGRTMAYITEGDWGNDLSLMSPDGEITWSQEGWGATDVAWSSNGHALAALLDTKRVVVLDGETTRQVREWSTLINGMSIAWVPGKDALSVLELFPTGCKVRVVEAPWTPLSFHFIPCGTASATETRGDLAWSPDGKTVAVGLRGDEGIRFIDATTGHLEFRDIPSSGYKPIALTWVPGRASLYVLTMCTIGCAPTRLDLLQFDLDDGSWKQLRSWNTVADRFDKATLELFGTDHIAVGPVNQSVLLVPLDDAGDTRTLLGENAYRASRRP